MPQFTFRAVWEEDDNTYRDILMGKNHNFAQFHQILIEAFELKKFESSSFYVSNDLWILKRRISSEVEKNIKGAAALSMQKTPVSALIDSPDQKFVYVFNEVGKSLTFHISLIGIKKGVEMQLDDPIIIKGRGLAPSKVRAQGIEKEQIKDEEDQYDLDQSELDKHGFSSE